MTITNKSFSVGDILLVVDGSYKEDSKLGITSEYSTFVYIGSSKFITVSNGKLKVITGTTSKKLIDSLLGQDLFIVLRPMKTVKPVDPPKPTPVEVKSIKLNTNSLNLKIGESEQLSATIEPSNATDKKLTWESSNNDVAVVSDGLVVGNKEGSAIITVKSNNGKIATCNVNVLKTDDGKQDDGGKDNKTYLNNKVLILVLIGLVILLIVSIIINKKNNKNEDVNNEDDFETDEDDDNSVNDDNYFY